MEVVVLPGTIYEVNSRQSKLSFQTSHDLQGLIEE